MEGTIKHLILKMLKKKSPVFGQKRDSVKSYTYFWDGFLLFWANARLKITQHFITYFHLIVIRIWYRTITGPRWTHFVQMYCLWCQQQHIWKHWSLFALLFYQWINNLCVVICRHVIFYVHNPAKHVLCPVCPTSWEPPQQTLLLLIPILYKMRLE